MLAIYEKVVEKLNNGQTVALARIIEKKGSAPRGVGAQMLVLADGSFYGTIGGGPLEDYVRREAVDCILSRKSKLLSLSLNKDQGGFPMMCGGQLMIHVEVLIPEPHLVVVGAGHIGQALAKMADILEWQVSLVDDRRELLESSEIPAKHRRIWGPSYGQALKNITISPNDYVVIVTRDSTGDEEALEQVIDSQAAYIGMIGSQRKIAAIYKNLENRGVNSEKLKQVNAPVGLNIGAKTPGEIAISILGQIVERFNHDSNKKAGS